MRCIVWLLLVVKTYSAGPTLSGDDSAGLLVDIPDIASFDDLDGVLGADDLDILNQWVSALSSVAPESDSTTSSPPCTEGSSPPSANLTMGRSDLPDIDDDHRPKKKIVMSISGLPHAINGTMWEDHMVGDIPEMDPPRMGFVSAPVLPPTSAPPATVPRIGKAALNLDERIEALRLLSSDPEMIPSAFFAAMEVHGVSRHRALHFRDETMRQTSLHKDIHDIILAASPTTANERVQNLLRQTFGPTRRIPCARPIGVWRRFCTEPLKAFVGGEDAPCRPETNGKGRASVRLSITQQKLLFTEELMALIAARDMASSGLSLHRRGWDAMSSRS